MLDRAITRLIRPTIDAIGSRLARAGWSADRITFLGFGVGLSAALAIALQRPLLGLGLLLASRLMDALDGAVARHTQTTDRGGFLDITLDFLFYASIPLAFALADPTRNALAARRGLASTDYPDKSFYFLGGLTEATETLLCFAAMCLWPQHFPTLALGFAALCAVTTGTRIWWGWKALG
jgi:hypothetical protein